MAHFCSQCGKPVMQGADFCTHCGASLTGKKTIRKEWQDKREKVIGQAGAPSRNWTRRLVIAGIIAAGIGWVYINMPEGGNAIIKAQPAVVTPASYSAAGEQMFDTPSRVENGKIVVPLELVKEREFVAFHYQAPNNLVPLLAYVSGEGKIVTAISMCEPCNSQRFHMKGENIVCNSCGTTWKIDSLEPVSGSCSKYPPDAVPNTVVGNEVQIDEHLVAQWHRRI
ncbi:MAG: DUF2318 domain-containing protein [Ignavibacteriae bacterium]|nr:DUF2318 domain-containing protein [Ignavibacteriota bacterium]